VATVTEGRSADTETSGIEARPSQQLPPVDPSSSSWPPIRRLGPEGRYHLEERIAAGGAATVWRAYDEHLDRSVAIKILHPHLVGDEDTVRRFERESRHAARLHHPNAIRIFDSGRVSDVVYLVMEYIDGPTLKDILREHGALTPWPVVAAIGEQIALALAEAHGQSLIHRDIKPANILFGTDGIIKVVDFGIAKALSGTTTELTAEGTTVGTATYIAPEQYAGDEVDARVDIYALGMVMYECLTGRPAYSGDTPTATAAARLTREIVPPRQIRADIDRRLEDIVVRCTRRDPSERYGDVGTVAQALRAIVPEAEPHELTRELVSASPPASPALPEFPDVDPHAVTDPAMVPGHRSRLRVGLAFLAGMALTALAVALLANRGAPSTATPSQFGEGALLTISAAGDYDPQGDGSENSSTVPSAYDTILSTAWTTDVYRSPDGVPFGGQKTGVGVYFDVGNTAEVRSIMLNLVDAGGSIQVYAADEIPAPVDGLVGWRAPVATLDAIDRDDPQIDLPAPLPRRYWLIWFTSLPEIAPGEQQGGIAEIRFLGTTPDPAPTDGDGS
jgi:eukaryotic-like serine/threonine-protein kinase